MEVIMKKRSILFMEIAVLFAVWTIPLFAGGGSQSAGGSMAGNAKEINFSWWGDETRNVATRKAVDFFMQDNPGISVVTSVLPGARETHDKILIELSAGTAPDLFQFSTEWMVSVAYTPKPVLQDLNELKEYIDFSTFDPSVLNAGLIRNRLLGLPTGVSGWEMSINLNALNAYVQKTGKPLPPTYGESWTVEDFIAFARDFKKTMGEDSALVEIGYDNSMHLFASTLSEITGAFYIDENANLKSTLQNITDALKLMQRYTEAGVLPAGNLQVEAIGQGTIGSVMVAEGKWVGWFNWTSNIPANETRSSSPVRLLAIPIIGRPQYDGFFVRPSQFWSISASSKFKPEAAKLLDYIVNNPKAIEALEQQRAVPPTTKGQEILAKLGKLEGPVYTATNFLVKNAASSYTPFILIEEVAQTFRDEYARFITGGSTAEASAKIIYDKWQNILADIRKTM
jgi:ABC-type glycerol-3-phosphate transport system substrate-binding protein